MPSPSSGTRGSTSRWRWSVRRTGSRPGRVTAAPHITGPVPMSGRHQPPSDLRDPVATMTSGGVRSFPQEWVRFTYFLSKISNIYLSIAKGPGQYYTNNNDATSPTAHYSKPQKMTERNLREFDQMTRGPDRASTRDRERPMSPGASSIKSSRLLGIHLGFDEK